MNRLKLITLLLPLITLAGCNLPASQPQLQSTQFIRVVPLASPTAIPISTETAVAPDHTTEPTPSVPGQSFTPAIYRDETNGFTLEYPDSWMVESDPHGSGRLSAGAQFTSWQHPFGGISQVPPGESVLDLLVLLWDPKNDLEAYAANRKVAWDASGFAILSEQRWTLDNGQPAIDYFIRTPDGAEAYFMFTTLGEQYLSLSGSGNLALLQEIGHTIQVIP